MIKLTSGTTQALYYSQKNNPLFSKPVFQITNLTKFNVGPPNKDRYKANLSDGTFYLKTVFSSELSELFDTKRIKLFDLVQLNLFSIRSKENNNYLYVQSFLDYVSCDSEIGKAVNISNGKVSLDPTRQDSKPEESKKDSFAHEPPKIIKTNQDLASKSSLAYDDSKKSKVDEEITEIKSIFPHKRNMIVVGRVVSKSDIRKFTTQKGEGKLFSFEIVDKTGQIKCVAFSENVDIFYPLIDNNCVYSISNATVKLSNKKFSSSTSDFEIHLERNSEIVKIEDESIPQFSFHFIKISDLPLCASLVDVIGVVKEVFPVSSVTIKSTGKENMKREVIIVDQTGSTRLTIWGPKAEEEIQNDHIIALKSVKVGEFNGISLSTVQSSQIMYNLDLQESLDLVNWYQEEGKDLVIEKPKRKDKLVLINTVKENMLEYASIKGEVIYLKEDSLYYEACPSENCNKKVVQEDNGNFRCEKCNYVYENCQYRYMSNIHVGDFTGQIWITIFDQTGKSLFGISAKEMKEMGESNPEDVHNLIKKLISKEFIFKIRSKQENYNGELKLKSSSMEISQINLVSETNKMLDIIEKVTI